MSLLGANHPTYFLSLQSSIANITLNPYPRSPLLLISRFLHSKRLRILLLPYVGELPAGLRGTVRVLLLPCSHIILYTFLPYPIPPSGYFPYIGEELDTCFSIIHSPLSLGEGPGVRLERLSGNEIVNSLNLPCTLSTLTYPSCSRATFIT